MTLQKFIEAQTHQMKQFEQYWNEKIVPYLSSEELAFWSEQASLWDWVEQYEDWASK